MIRSLFNRIFLPCGEPGKGRRGAAIVAAGALEPLIPTLSSPDFLCQRYAAMGIGNLATNMANQEKILQEGALQPLLSLARRDNGDLDSQRYAVFAQSWLKMTRQWEAQEALELGRAEASANALMVKRQSEHVDALESRSAVCRSLSLSLIRAHMYICAIHVCV